MVERNPKKSMSCRERGAVLIVVLVCLALATAMFLLVAKQAVAERQTVQMRQNGLQARWLAEAGVERAAARLAADPNYSGETWTIAAKQLDGENDAVVRIQVEKTPDRTERREIRVEADCMDKSDHRCRHVKQIIVDRDAIQTRERTQPTN